MNEKKLELAWGVLLAATFFIGLIVPAAIIMWVWVIRYITGG